MTIKHTPGPWKVVEPVAIDYRAPLVYGANGRSLVAVAEGGGRERAVDGAEARANAHLMAAAPEMLHELRTSHCPGGGYTGQPEFEEPTVENCLKSGMCGCSAGAAVRKAIGT